MILRLALIEDLNSHHGMKLKPPDFHYSDCRGDYNLEEFFASALEKTFTTVGLEDLEKLFDVMEGKESLEGIWARKAKEL